MLSSHRALQKLCKHGNATALCIPRFVLYDLGWICGQAVMVEILEDRSVRLRLPCADDFAPIGNGRIISTGAPVVK